MAQMEASKIAITPVLQQVESRYWPNILAQAHRRRASNCRRRSSWRGWTFSWT